jgi:TDG/mug DNA glycosylase family protein
VRGDDKLPPDLPDIIAPGLKIIFCGLNPGLSAAVGGHHFLNRSNRFWKVLHLSGLTPRQIDPREDRQILSYGYGLTAAVPRATVSAAELLRGEFAGSAKALEKKIVKYRPRWLAFLGKAAYAEISGEKDLQWGEQASRFGGARVWVLPNPSGLNRNFSLPGLIEHYAALREALTG